MSSNVQNNVQFQCFLMSLFKVKFGSEQFVATPGNVFFPLQWVIIIISIISGSEGIFVFFQTHVCVSLDPKTNTVKLVVDGESIVDEVRL